MVAGEAGTQASHARSNSIVQEVRGLLHEMQHAVAVPGESPGAALLPDAPMAGQKPPLTLVRLLNQQQQLWQFHLRQGRRRPRVLVAAPPPRSRARWSSHRRPARPPARLAIQVGRRRGRYCWRQASLASRSAQRRNGGATPQCPPPRRDPAAAAAAHGRARSRWKGCPEIVKGVRADFGVPEGVAADLHFEMG